MRPTQLTNLANAYAAHRGLKLSTLGVYAVNDGKFFGRLAEGFDCRTKTAAKVAAWFAANWPSDLEWPRDIPRPAAQKVGRAA
ncbi:MAG: hypothetical protein IE922_09625 [Sphingomonadales bacterium]|nr:hypothetical protein [Sphingomonadales bacterium]